jgi:hypothetical protein
MFADGAMPMASSGIGAAVEQRGHANVFATSGAGRGIVTRHDGHALPAGPPDPQKKQYETIPLVMSRAPREGS